MFSLKIQELTGKHSEFEDQNYSNKEKSVETVDSSI
jgi:hypothetical protein